MDTWQAINSAAPEEAARLLASACGSSRWVERMLRARPFASREALLSAAQAEWQGLTPDDWREAFGHHPKIGDRQRLRERFPSTHQLSAQEQAGIDGASDAVLDALADANRRYEATFGYIFIVCATGRSASEMLALLTARLENDLEHEVHIAAAEQAKITALRLASSPSPPTSQLPG
jgi:2-oxo-4-hydroxy-4-carboxy-5-ureidoimidazoline decarboxylase